MTRTLLARALEALEDMVIQFAPSTGREGEYTTEGLSALEAAFNVLEEAGRWRAVDSTGLVFRSMRR